MTKNELRKHFLSLRDNIAESQREIFNASITRALLSHDKFQDSKVIFTYVSFRSEVDTLTLIDRAFELGKRVFVPVVNTAERNMHAAEIFSKQDLKSGYKGILEPAFDTPVADVVEIDLAIIPGAVFDYKGYRIGYGGGYYDRFLPQLSSHAFFMGLAFPNQMVERVPTEKHDVPLHQILTPAI